MSVIRNSSSRAQARKAWSSPYSRIAKPVNSLLGWISYILPGHASESSLPTHSDEPNADNTSPERAQSPNQEPVVLESTTEPTPATNNTTRSQDPPSQHQNSSAGGSGAAQKVTAFEFQYATPSGPSSSFPSNTLGAEPNTPTPRKKLTRNPNGSYRWEGAGSAKKPRTRNRYASPAFGVSPKPQHILMRDSSSTGESSVADSKRRKLDDEQSSGPESPKKASAVPFPNSSPTTPRANGANGSSSRTAAPLSTSRLRTPAKPTVPAIPSPLRQAWSDASSASSREESRASPPQAAKQTQTASFMAELIKETTPPKRPDLSNPYQTASPIGKVGPPKRSTRRPRATGKPSAPAKEQGTEEKVAATSDKDKVKEYSPQAIIEATVPKGSKRSRPPAHLEKRSPSEEAPPAPVKDEGPTVIETRKAAYVVEEPEEDEDEARRATKKAKPSINGHGLPSSVKSASPTPAPDVDIVVEEVDVDMNSAADREKSKEPAKPTVQVNGSTSQSPLSATSPTSRPFTGMKSNSIPKEPSKLRFSFQADTPTAPPMPSTTSPISDVAPATPQPAPPLPKTDFRFSPPSSGFNFTFKADSAPTENVAEKVPESDTEAIKEKVRAVPVPSLPVFTFGVDGTSVLPSSSEHSKVQNDVKVLPKSSLPTFAFGSSKSTPFAFDYDRSMAKAPGSYDGSYKPSPPKTHKPAIIRPISSPSSAPSTPTPPPVKGFDFAAAGMKAPVAAKDFKTCSSCGLSSPTSAQKCTVCDEPFPGSASAASPPISTPAPPAPPTGGFNWAAAGMKPPSAPQGKICSSCGLSSPTSAQKCTVCDEPFPGSASAASPPVSAPTPPAPPAGGFNWAAAGIKPPSAPQGTWKCSDCGLNSPEAKIECTVCGAPKP